MVGLDEVVVVAGGHVRFANDTSDKVEAMTLNTRKTLVDLPHKTKYAFGGVLLGQPIVCGGTSHEGFHKECFKLTLDGSAWEHLADMFEPRAAASAVVLNQEIWITGGNSGPEPRFLKTTEKISLDGTVSPGPNLPVPLIGHCTVRSYGQIFIIGGASQSTTYVYDLDLTRVRNGPSLNSARNIHACTEVASANHGGRNILIVLGGFDEPDIRKTEWTVEILDYSISNAKWILSKQVLYIGYVVLFSTYVPLYLVDNMLPTNMWNKPGLHPLPDGNGVLIVYREVSYKLIIKDNEYTYEEAEVGLKYPREAFVSMVIPMDVYKKWNT